MYRFLFRFFVTIITILTANLLTTAISDYLITFKNHYNPLRFTLIGMAIIVLIFYPLFLKLEDWIKSISARVIRSGNSVAGKYFGLPVTFITVMLILFYFYARMWYNIDYLQIVLYDLGDYFKHKFSLAAALP